MALGPFKPSRTRPSPKSPIARTGLFSRFLADLHDVWLACRFAARARRELITLDDRILRDIGLNRAVIEDILSEKRPPVRPAQRRIHAVWRKLHNSAPLRPRSRPSGSQY